jgi:hypothetical protein
MGGWRDPMTDGCFPTRAVAEAELEAIFSEAAGARSSSGRNALVA